MLEREKQPALARSDTHDVGHAEGAGEKDKLDYVSKALNQKFKNAMSRKTGL
jgi:hypothetical protein